MKQSILALFLIIASLGAYAQKDLKTIFEKSEFLETSTYEQGIAFYSSLARQSEWVQMSEHGLTDAGYPLHLVLIAKDKDFDIQSNRQKGKSILLINNAIHPGEPDGIEASQMLARDLVINKKMSRLLDNTLVAIIPFYNIGGVLNRNKGSRTNQNGPEVKGFRGNARNFDLNRDVIKNDTRNARSFAGIFHLLDPDVLIDTHVSNGADYSYVLTMVTPQSDKLGEPLKGFLDDNMLPSLFEQMASTPYEMSYYVNVWGSTPDKGWTQFFDAPRYSSGYAALFQTIAFQSETHMLKTFEDRTWATYNFLHQALIFLDKQGKALQDVRRAARTKVQSLDSFAINWQPDRSDSSMITFKGYKATYPESQVTGLQRLKYDRTQPYTMQVPFYNSYKASTVVSRPRFYVIPQAWTAIIKAMERNEVKMRVLDKDTTVQAEVYYISNYESRKSPWEGHYFHNEVQTEKVDELLALRSGDVLVPVNQVTNRYIIETLEPEGADSFFRWNFFDSMLQMKEGFSSYVFEDEAIDILNNNPELKKMFEDKKASDESFRSNADAQLGFIWMHTEHKEPSYMRYPIYRVR